MRQCRESRAQILEAHHIDIGGYDARPHRTLSEYLTPRPDDHGVPIGSTTATMLSALCGRDNVAERLDGARTQQNVPVGLARRHGERGRER